MFNHMIGNITKIRLRSYICASSDVFLPSISSLKLKLRLYPAINTTCYPTAPLYNIIIIFDMILVFIKSEAKF